MVVKRKIYEIDATGQRLGRLAAKIAVLLRGKNRVDFSPNKDEGGIVVVKNVKKIVLTGKKIENKIYYHHSGYPGGLKKRTLKELLEKNPKEVLRRAVWGMLPKNKLRAKQIKRLKIEL